MKPTGPESLTENLAEFLRNGDVDSVMRLYEPDAVFADTNGATRGTDHIRAAHQAFVDEGLELNLVESYVLETESVALVHWAWTVARQDGSTIEGVSAEVLRKQSDGSWKFIIDNSDGAALVGTPR